MINVLSKPIHACCCSGIACGACAVERMTIPTLSFFSVVRSGDYYLFETDSEEEEDDEEKNDDPPKKSAFQVRRFELYSTGMLLFNAGSIIFIFLSGLVQYPNTITQV